MSGSIYNPEIDNKEVLIYDIECETIGPKPDADKDRLKIFGFYSYKAKKYGMIPYWDKEAIQKVISSHKFLVGFNNENYDDPILKREGYDLEFKRIIDLRKIIKMRKASMITKKGMLGNVLMRLSLDYITRFLDIVDEDAAKEDIDYAIFKKPNWTPEEIKEIHKYTIRDIEVTKKLYEWVDEYFYGFKDFISKQDYEKKYHLTDSIAKFAYKAICYAMGWEPTYNRHFDDLTDEEKISGGYVAYPAGEKFEGDIYCIDYNSLYPKIMMQCNLFGRNKNSLEGWHGGDKWEVEGYYDDKEMHPVGKLLRAWYYLRLFYKRQLVRQDGMVVKMSDLQKHIGSNFFRVHRDDGGHVELESFTLTEKDVDFYNNILKQGKDRREYTVKIIINTCFSRDTEILTEEGVKLIKDCKKGDKVYSINKETGNVELKKIVATQKIKYDADMINFKSQHNDLLVTPDHDMLVEKDNRIETKKAIDIKDDKFKFPSSNSIKGSNDKYLDMLEFNKLDYLWSVKLNDTYSQRKNSSLVYNPNTRLHKSLIGYQKNIDGKWFVQGRARDNKYNRYLDIRKILYFCGFYLADGSLRVSEQKSYDNGNFRGKTYEVHITKYKYKKTKIYNKIKNIMSDLGFRFKEHDKGFVICSKLLYDFISENFGCDTSTKHIPDWVFRYDHNILNYLHDGMYDCDGTSKQYKYSTKTKLLRDSFMKLMLAIGYKPHYYYESGIWRISRDNITYNNPLKNETIKNNSEYVYCVTVEDNHTVFAGRNGKFQWVGQCYGILNNQYYELVYDLIAGGDCTRIGRQWTKYARKVFRDDGYKILYTDTDSWYVLDTFKDKEKLLATIKKVIDSIKSTVPFPQPTFDAGIDDEIKYMFFFKGSKKDDGTPEDEMDEDDFVNRPKGFMKKNYIYVTKDGGLTIKNLGIKKKNISAVSKEIFWKHMVPKIKTEGKIKYDRSEIHNLMIKLLEENIELAYMRKEVGPLTQYRKSMTGMQAQISKAYGPGIHFLIPNKRDIGVGKDMRYCSDEEFKKYRMDVGDIDFGNFWKELNYFIKEKKELNLGDFW